MSKPYAKSIIPFLTVILLISVINLSFSSKNLDKNLENRYNEDPTDTPSSLKSLDRNSQNGDGHPQKDIPNKRQKAVISLKPKETSLFTVIEIEDLAYPTLPASIRLPYRVNPNNTVVLAAKHAYITTEKHLHVIDVSTPQFPSYLTTLAFKDTIGKVLASGNLLVVASKKKFHVVDVSQPSHPTHQSTNYLSDRSAIIDIDVRDAHLYIVGENETLHIYSLHTGHVLPVKSEKLKNRWWLLSPDAVVPKVKQIPLPTTTTISSVLSEPLLSERGFLQLHSSRGEKVRASSNFLVMESLRDPTCDLLISAAEKINNLSQSQSLGFFKVDYSYLNHLDATGQKTVIRGKPTNAYFVNSGKMHQLTQVSSNKEINVNTKQLIGAVSDFQILENMLYIINEKGFLSIYQLSKEDKGKTWFSTTPLQASRPISIAVDKYFVYVLAIPEDSVQ